MNLQGMRLEALVETRDREKELADKAASGCARLREEIRLADKQLKDLREALRVLSSREGDHRQNHAMAQAYLDMRHGKTE